MFLTLPLLIALVTPADGHHHLPHPKAELLDEVLGAGIAPDAPGCSFGIIQEGAWIYKNNFGLANLDYGIPLSSSSVFRIASLSKQFTAFSVLTAQQEGYLSLDDPVRKYLPEIPPRQPVVTIRHLLEHTGGYRNYLDLIYLAGRHHEDYSNERETLQLLIQQKEHNFPAGSWQMISDTGYFLLSLIIEKATGQSLAEYAAEKIFVPLGMQSSFYLNDPSDIVRWRAVGYAPRQGDDFRISETRNEVTGDGGIYTSVDDLFHWALNIAKPRIGTPEIYDVMMRPSIDAGGFTHPHGYGWYLRRYQGILQVGHSGGYAGFRSAMMTYPEEGLTVIGLCNRSDVRPEPRAWKVVKILLEDRLEPLPTGPDPSVFAGEWWDDRQQSLTVIEVDDNELRMSFPPLPRVFNYSVFDETSFGRDKSPFSRIRSFEQNGEQKLLRRWSSEHPVVLRRIERTAAAPAKSYAGSFHCDEIPLRVDLAAHRGELFWENSPPRKTSIRLYPMTMDKFRTEHYWSVVFERSSETEDITGLRLSTLTTTSGVYCQRIDSDHTNNQTKH